MGEVEAEVCARRYWQASQDSGFSSEQASASSSVKDLRCVSPPVGPEGPDGVGVGAAPDVVVLLMRAAGR
ncbi:MAG TPA: hypothetical protein PKA24_16105, partial [Microthrixaceae bacterium]|nr:hypothetical protein [Microthrixaceae bacterium]